MDDRKLLTHLHVEIDKEKVFAQLNCFPDSPVYHEMEETFREILPEILALCRPKGILGKGYVPAACRTDGGSGKEDAVLSILTVGQEISDYSSRAFQNGDYVRGMLADAMADAALFSLETDSQKVLHSFCREWKLGIRRRLAAPQDLTMEMQREALIQLHADRLLGLEITEGFMYRPLKTSCSVYLTSPDTQLFRVGHNCRTCPNLTCSLRHVEPVKITVLESSDCPATAEEAVSGAVSRITFESGGTLLEDMRKNGFSIPAVCGGTGRCGKCRIRVLEGHLEISAEDRNVFSPEELAEGWRLACHGVPEEDLVIWMKSSRQKEIQAVTAFETTIPEKHPEIEGRLPGSSDGSYALAIDLGTTTLAIQMVWEKNQDTYTALNPQAQYGADVIARIQAANNGDGPVLRDLIRTALYDGIRRLQSRNHVTWNGLSVAAVAGNTTMIHLLMGFSCEELGHAPFRPCHMEALKFPLRQWFDEADPRTQVKIYPGISAFVGSDIVSGLCALSMESSDQISMLIDLGTNGEMVLGNKERMLAASTAAGPAFEGGNIICGTGSVPGAICSAHWTGTSLSFETIGGQPPIGICGTGVIEITEELLRREVIDDTGKMESPWFENGYEIARMPGNEQICLWQKDVREIQLAKAAVRAGIETLLKRYGVTASQVSRVCLAGGFGYRLDCEKAIQIGMFPEEFSGIIQAVGNTSLSGAVMLAEDPESMRKAEEILRHAAELSLSEDPFFQQGYIEHMLLSE